jgi:copper chaperone NosL
MQISQPRFAAEILTPEGTYAKFDDLGCFRAHRAAHADLAAAPAWVVDYETGGWIEAQRAVYAGGAREPTPMASGLVATSSRERAAALGTDVLSYEQMLAAGSASRHP